MPYVKRDTNGEIIALFSEPDEETGIWENLPGDSLAIQLFLNRPETVPSIPEEREDEEKEREIEETPVGIGVKLAIERLDDTDRAMIRVVEDLIEVLIEKNIIKITDLPGITQEKILSRKKIRQLMGDLRFAAEPMQKDDDTI